jgi:hypothetical protein
VIVLLVACGTSGPVSWWTNPDGGLGGEPGSLPDAAIDGGELSDAAVASDAGEPQDAGEPSDGAVVVVRDAGQEHDAGPGFKDAGEPGDAGVCQPSLPGIGQVSAACQMCAESACASQVSMAENSCSSYSQCVCGCNGDKTCENGCLMNVSRGCQGAVRPVEQCAFQSCPNECGMMMGGPPPPTDGGMMALDGGDPCSTLAACCGSLPQMYQGYCKNIVAQGNEGTCSMALNQAQSANYCQ